MLLFLMWLDRHVQSIWASLQYLCDILKKVWNEIRNLTSLAGLNPTLTVCYSFHIVLLPSQYGIWLLCFCNLTLPVPCISQSYTEIKIKLNFYFHTSLWCPKTFVWKRFLILIWTWSTVPVYGEQSLAIMIIKGSFI